MTDHAGIAGKLAEVYLLVGPLYRRVLREVERHLGVSYPTARLRFDRLLEKLGLADEPEQVPLNREQVLSEVASGALSPEEAARLLAEL